MYKAYHSVLFLKNHYNDVIMSEIASQNSSLMLINWTVYSGADQRKHQSSASLAFVGGIHRWPVNSPDKGPVTRKMFPFDDVIMIRDRDRYQITIKHNKLASFPFRNSHYNNMMITTLLSGSYAPMGILIYGKAAFILTWHPWSQLYIRIWRHNRLFDTGG